MALVLVLSMAPAAGGATDPGYARQWNLVQIHAEEGWASGQGQGAVVAVVDSGVDLVHEDLRDRIAGEVSCIGANGDPLRCGGSGQDDDGHGTHVAGIVAASAGDSVGVVGVAPQASLLAVRVLHRQCDAAGCAVGGSGADVAAGIRWASRHGADVINLSLGNTVSGTLGPDFDRAIEEAWSAGAVVVLAAGNDLASSPLTPGSPAIVVTATARGDNRPDYAYRAEARGHPARFGMAAPGGETGDTPVTCTSHPVGVLSTYLRDGQGTYGCLAGTSMAAPHVAGAAAVLRGLGLSAPETRTRLLATADDLGAPGPDPAYGAGRLNLGRAVTEAVVVPRSDERTTIGESAAGAGSPGGGGAGALLPVPTLLPTTAPPPTLPPPSAPPPPVAPPTAAPPTSAPDRVTLGAVRDGRSGASRLVPGAGAAVLAAGTGAGAWRVRRRTLG